MDSKNLGSRKELKSGFPPNFKLYENEKTSFSSPFSVSPHGINTALRLGGVILQRSNPSRAAPRGVSVQLPVCRQVTSMSKCIDVPAFRAAKHLFAQVAIQILFSVCLDIQKVEKHHITYWKAFFKNMQFFYCSEVPMFWTAVFHYKKEK